MGNKKKKNSLRQQEEMLSFTKKIVLFVLVVSEIEILLSYALAFLGKENIAENLSSQVVITCLGGLVFYLIKSLVENLSKYGTIFGKKGKAKHEELNIDVSASEDSDVTDDN